MKNFHRRAAAYVAYHARRRPEKTAVIRNGVPVTYAALNRDLACMTQALAGFGLIPGQIAAVSHDDLYIQLLIVFGFETLGVVTGSYRPGESHESANLIAAADIVLVQNPVTRNTTGRIVTLTDDWTTAILARQPPAPMPIPPAASENPLVIFRSSGTTGSPKLMLLTHRVLNNRLAQQRRRDSGLGLTRESRFFATMHFSVGSMYMSAANCLRLGAIFMFETAQSAAAALPVLRPTHFTILPYHLRRLLQRHQSPRLPDLTVQSIGGRLAVELRGLTLQKLAGKLIENYGSNEMGSIGEVDAAGIVTLIAGVEAQVMDDEKILSQGEIGVLRVRSPIMIAGYLNDAAATAVMFRDGWFAPGDLGMLTPTGRLRLIGRRADVLNLGGAKIAAADLEARIDKFPGLLDMALVQPSAFSETMRVAVCIVTTRGFDMPGFLAAIRPVINYPFTVNPVEAIPRTIEGKIRRTELQQMILVNMRPAKAALQLESANGR